MNDSYTTYSIDVESCSSQNGWKGGIWRIPFRAGLAWKCKFLLSTRCGSSPQKMPSVRWITHARLPWNSSRYPLLGGFSTILGAHHWFMRAVSLVKFSAFCRDASGVWVGPYHPPPSGLIPNQVQHVKCPWNLLVPQWEMSLGALRNETSWSLREIPVTPQ